MPPGSYDIYIAVYDYQDFNRPTAFYIDQVELTPIPEPGTFILFGLGTLGLAGYRRYRWKSKPGASTESQ